MDIDKIMTLVDKVASAPISSLNIEEGNFKISIKKQLSPSGAAALEAVPVITPHHEPVQVQQVQSLPEQLDNKEEEEKSEYILAPLVGIFYEAPGPDHEPFVRVGDPVKKGQVVGIIEAMKLMNEVESDVDGIITEILIENNQGIEYGQPLFKIN